MADVALLAVAGVVLLQFVLAIYAYVDANRRDLDKPGMYWYGITIPVAGLYVFVAYLSRRDELPTADLAPPTASGDAGEEVWTIEHRGLRRLPRRLAYSAQGSTTLWRVAVAGPPLLLALTALVDSRIGIALSGFCGVFWLTYLGSTRAFTNTTTHLDPADGTIELTMRGGDHPLSPSGFEQEIDLDDVRRAELRRVGTQPLVVFRYERRFSVNLRTLLVPPGQLDVLRETLASHEIPVRDRIEDGTDRPLVRRRNLEGLISLVAIPLGAGFVWPQYFFTLPVFLLTGFTTVWLVVKGFVAVFGGLKALLGAVTD